MFAVIAGKKEAATGIISKELDHLFTEVFGLDKPLRIKSGFIKVQQGHDHKRVCGYVGLCQGGD